MFCLFAFIITMASMVNVIIANAVVILNPKPDILS